MHLPLSLWRCFLRLNLLPRTQSKYQAPVLVFFSTCKVPTVCAYVACFASACQCYAFDIFHRRSVGSRLQSVPEGPRNARAVHVSAPARGRGAPHAGRARHPDARGGDCVHRKSKSVAAICNRSSVIKAALGNGTFVLKTSDWVDVRIMQALVVVCTLTL